VDVHVLRETARLGARVDRLTGDVAGRVGDVLQPGLRTFRLDRAWRHVRVPVICCAFSSSWTVLRPLIARTMTTIPKAISTAPDTRPPIFRTRCIEPLRLVGAVATLPATRGLRVIRFG